MLKRGENTSRKRPGAPDDADLDAYSIAQFCARHGLSIQSFYKFKALGLMPKTFRVGTRVLISREAAKRWRSACEAREKTTAGSDAAA
ncbi:hypothetical protein [Bradyrhizobium erythrophlei]|uniref:Helix-turn-helix domain-containing protein n=1 Tax=Bradyrhizobium erythrophlei TaxID=1437360 RepID=A0A1M5YIZ2_9BRAD|nr:hypothetical protein [Bradyrhizobium erythrophlei]SHI11922.1 hypothetical protein SAMN05443248_8375 [Bradyrhizobium erythrophlei]